MQRFFRPEVNALSIDALFKMAFVLATLSRLPLTNAYSESCFEGGGAGDIAGHDYSLQCARGGELIMQELVARCGIYNDGLDDCARFFVITLEFCKGMVGDAICTLNSHIEPSPCITNVTKTLCTDGFGSTGDWMLTVFGSLGVIGLMICCCCCMMELNKAQEELNRTARRNEHEPLLADEAGQEAEQSVENTDLENASTAEAPAPAIPTKPTPTVSDDEDHDPAPICAGGSGRTGMRR